MNALPTSWLIIRVTTALPACTHRCRREVYTLQDSKHRYHNKKIVSVSLCRLGGVTTMTCLVEKESLKVQRCCLLYTGGKCHKEADVRTPGMQMQTSTLTATSRCRHRCTAPAPTAHSFFLDLLVVVSECPTSPRTKQITCSHQAVAHFGTVHVERRRCSGVGGVVEYLDELAWTQMFALMCPNEHSSDQN